MSRNPSRRPGVETTPSADGFLAKANDSQAVTWLNRTGYLVLELCTGANDAVQIANALMNAFDLAEPPLASVRETLSDLVAAGLITPGDDMSHAEMSLEIALWAPADSVETAVLELLIPMLARWHESGVAARVSVDRQPSMRVARNAAANRVLRGHGATHILFLDATSAAVTAARDCDLPRLLGSAHEAIGIPVPIGPLAWDRARAAAAALPPVDGRHIEAYARTYDVSFGAEFTQADLESGFIEGRHCSSGALLLQRGALARIAGSGSANRHRGNISHGRIEMADGWGFFDPGLSAEAIDIDEDLAFCERLRSAGGRLMIALTGGFGTSVEIARRLHDGGA